MLANGSSVFTGTGITDMNVTLKYMPVIGNLSVGSFLVPFSFELTDERPLDGFHRAIGRVRLLRAGDEFRELYTGPESLRLERRQDADVPGVGFAQQPCGTALRASITATTTWPPAASPPCRITMTRPTAATWCTWVSTAAPSNARTTRSWPALPDATQLRPASPPATYLSPLTQSITNTGVIDGDDQYYAEGAELVAQAGPWCFESEIYASQVTDDNGSGGAGADTLLFKGMYAQLMYMLTGENRNYNRERGSFERVVPYEDYVRMPGEYAAPAAWAPGRSAFAIPMSI